MKTFNKHRGFTLIEIVLAIITVSIVAVPMIGLFSEVSKSLVLNSETNEADGYVQACAEHIVVNKETDGIALIDNTICSGITTSAAFSLTVVTTTDVSAHATCPTAIGSPTCKVAEISAVTNGNNRSSAVIFLLE